MIRVLVSDPGSGRRSKLRHVVNVIVGELGARNYGVSCVGAPEDLATAFDRVRKGFYDIVVCRIDDECAQRTFEALERVREQDQDVSIVVVADGGCICALVCLGLSEAAESEARDTKLSETYNSQVDAWVEEANPVYHIDRF